MHSIRRLHLMAGLLFGLVLSSGGCCTFDPGPRAYQINVSLDEAAWRAGGAQQVPSKNFEVLLIAVNPDSRAAYENASVAELFSPTSPLITDADIHRIEFKIGQSQPKMFSRSAEAWSDWLNRGADHLVVAANIDPSSTAAAATDPRRIVLPLDVCAWKGMNPTTLDIVVKSSSLVCTTERAPAK